jgi:hypothetical protein
MKKLIIGAAAILFISSTVLAQDKAKEKTCKKGSACCKQPSKTATLRAKPVKVAAQLRNKKDGLMGRLFL